MTPCSLNNQPSKPAQPLQFVRGEDGRFRAGPYTLVPDRVGFDIPVVYIFREGVRVHRTVGRDCQAIAEHWANCDAWSQGFLATMMPGQQALL